MQEYNTKTAEIVRIIEITEIIVQHNIMLSPELKSALAQCEEVFQVRIALDILLNSSLSKGPSYITAENIFLLLKNSMHAKKIAGAFVRLKSEYYADISNRIFICESETAVKVELAECINHLGQAGILEANRETLRNADYEFVRCLAKILILLNSVEILTQAKFNDLREKQQSLPGMLVVLKKLPAEQYWRIWDGLCEYAHIFNESEIREKISEVKQLDRQIFDEIIKIFQQSSRETLADTTGTYLAFVKEMQAHDIRLIDNVSLNSREESASIASASLKFNETKRELLSIVGEEDKPILEALKARKTQAVPREDSEKQAQLLLSYKQSHFAPKVGKPDSNPDLIVASQGPSKSA